MVETAAAAVVRIVVLAVKEAAEEKKAGFLAEQLHEGPGEGAT